MVLFLRALQVSSGLQGFGHVSEMFATKISECRHVSLYRGFKWGAYLAATSTMSGRLQNLSVVSV